MIFSGLFSIFIGSISDPIKKAMNAMARVNARLPVTGFSESSKNTAKTRRTIRGLKMCDLSMVLLLKKFRKFSLGYKFIKKLLTHWFSINAKIEKIVVNSNDL